MLAAITSEMADFATDSSREGDGFEPSRSPIRRIYANTEIAADRRSATGLETMIRGLDPPPNPRGDRGFESIPIDDRPYTHRAARREYGKGSAMNESDIDDHLDMNAGKEWSEMDLFDLANSVRLKNPIEEIAMFLCRSLREEREKIAELERTRELARTRPLRSDRVQGVL
jgi:hypothetical protein